MRILMICRMLAEIDTESEYPFLQPLVLLKELMIASITSVGVILLIKNAVDFFAALNAKDNSGMWDAGLRMLGSLAIAGLGMLLKFLGIE